MFLSYMDNFEKVMFLYFFSFVLQLLFYKPSATHIEVHISTNTCLLNRKAQ